MLRRIKMNPKDKNELKFESRQCCQSCGKRLFYGDEVIEIRSGKLNANVRYDITRWNEKLFFHKDCDIAIPGND